MGDRQIVLNANLKKDETDPVEIIPYTVDIDSDTTIVDLPRMYGKEGFDPEEKTLLGWSTDPNASVPDIENANTGKYYSDGSKYKVNKTDGKYSADPIELYAVWKDYFTVSVTDKNWGEADKRDIKLGLMSRTAVGAPGSEVINDPLAAHIPYYTKPEDIKDYPADGGTVEWKVPGYDINGARLSYVVVELNDQTLPIFENSNDWASLGVTLTETIVNQDGTVIPGHKRQIVSFPNPNDNDKIDAFSGATTRTALFKGDEKGYYDQIGYNIKIENKKIVVPPPVINQSYEEETFFDFKIPDSNEINKLTFRITRGSGVEKITLTKDVNGTWISDKGTLINKDETLLRIKELAPFSKNDTVEGVSHTKDGDSDSVTMKVKAKIDSAKPKDEKQAYKEGNNLIITAKEGVEVLGNDSGAKAPEGTIFELLVNKGTDESPNFEKVQGVSLTQNDEGLLKFSIPEGNLNHGDKVVIQQTEPRKSPAISGTVTVDKEGPYIKLYDEINKTYTNQIKVYEGIKLPAYTLKTFLDDQAKNEDLAKLVLNETSSGLKIEDPEAENIRWPIYGDNTLEYKDGKFIVTATDEFGNSRQTSFNEVLSKPVRGNIDPNSQIPDGFVRITFDALESGHYDDNSKKMVYDVIKGLTWDQAENSEPKVLVPQPKYKNSTKVFAGTWSSGTENGIKLPPEDLQESILENITYSAEYKVRETDNVIKAANPNDASEQPSGFVKVSLHAGENSDFEHEQSKKLVIYYVNPEADMTYRQLKAPSVKATNGYEVNKINPWYSIIDGKTQTIGEAQLDDPIKTDIDIYVNLVKTVIENPNGDTPQEGYVRIIFEPGDGGSFDQGEVVKFDILKGTSLARAKEAGFKIPTPETDKIHNGWEAKDTVFLKDLSDYTINFNEDLTFIAKYITNSNETVIPYEPTDPQNPTDENDGNIPNVDKDGNIVDKEQYVRVAFNVAPERSGTLTLGNIAEKEVISALVKKDTLWSDVTLPTKTPTGEYKFWFWTDASIEKVADGDIRTANFIKSGDEVRVEDKDKNLPDGMFKVTVVRDENSIKENVLYGKVYAVDKNNKLEQEKFPVLEAMDDYKDAKWNDGKKDVTDPSQEVINKDTIFTASAVSTLFDKDNVTGLEITTPPTKEDYKVGENFDPTGMVITLTDKNGNTQEVTPDKLGEYGITLEPKDNLQLGTDKITVKKGDNLSDATPITVVKGNSEKDVISFVPADPTNPANPEDTNIPTNDSDGNPIDKNDYILIGFKTENVDKGLLTLGEKADQGAISLLVKKDLTWEKVTAPTPVGKDGNEFWKWTPVLPTSTETVVNKSVYTANFIKTGDEVNPEDNLPNGWFKVSIEKGTGIEENDLFGKTYAVKGGESLEAKKFPQLQVSTDYKDAKWNDGEKDVADPSKEVINKDTTFTASAVSTLFDKDNVTELKITTPPTKEDYKVGENFDPTGMVITLTDKNGNTQEVTPDKLGEYGITLEPKDDLQLGTNEITVKKGDLSDTTPITVKDAPVDAPVAPKVDTIKEGAKDIKVTVPEDGDKIEITLPDDTKVVVEKGEDGTWKTEDGKTVVEEDGKLVIPVDPSKVVQGGEGVIVTVTDSKTNKTSDPAKVEVTASPNAPVAPKVDTIKEGAKDIKVTVPEDGDKIEITLPDDTKVVVEKGEDGAWKTEDGKTVVEEDGKLVIPVDPSKIVQGGEGVIVTVTDSKTNKTSDPAKVEVTAVDEPIDNKSTKPNVDTIEVGDTEITGTGTPGATVTVTNPDGTTKDVTVNPDGTWTVTIDKAEAGDSYDITQTEEGKTPSEKETQVVLTSEQSTKPNVNPVKVGDTEITGTGTPGATVTVTNPDGTTKDVTVNPDGTWTVTIDKVEAGDSYEVTQTEEGKKASGEVTVRIKNSDNDNDSNVIWTGTVLGLGTGNFESEEVEKDFEIDIAYIHGYPNGEVRPDGNITRAEAAAMFARILKLDQSNSSNPNFADTDNVNAWYNASINAVVAKGLMKGYPDGNFKPNAPITRAEFAQLIKTIDKANSGNAPFEDIKGHWAKEAIDQAYANDRIAGYPDGSFRPDKSITRAEAAKIINSLFDRMVRAKGLLSIESGTIKHYTDIDVSHWGYYEIVEASNTHMFERIYKGAIEEEWSRVIDSYIQP